MTWEWFQRYRIDRILAFGVVPALLVVLNVLLVYPIFSGELSRFVGSIEVGYIQAGQFLKDIHPHGWNPLWYNGFPFHVMYNPIPPYLEWFTSAVSGWGMGHVYRFLTGLAYVLTPAAIYLFARKILRSAVAGIIVGLLWTFGPSFASLFSVLRADAIANGSPPWQLLVLIEYGEGTHTLGLLFLPIFGWLLLRLYENPDFRRVLWAGLALAVVALTSMIAFFAGLLFFAVVALSEGLLAGKKKHRPWRTAGTTLALTVGLIAFWFNPDFLWTSFGFGSGGEILKTYGQYFLYLPVAGAVIFALIYAFFRGRVERQSLLILLLWFLGLAAIVAGWQLLGVQLAPQPIRYLPEANLAAALLVSFAVAVAIRVLRRFKLAGQIASAILVFLIIGLIDLVAQPFLRSSRDFVAPRVYPIAESREYRLSKAIEALPGAERVYATGNDAFYLNLFTRVPQLRGALDQAATNRWWNHASYQLVTGSDPAVADALVRAMNLNYVVVTTGASKNPYHDYHYPEKFSSWPKAYEAEGDLIYRSDLNVPGLVQLVDAQKFPTLRRPVNAVDLPHLNAYADWVDRRARPVDRLAWENGSRGVIQAAPQAGELVSVQVTYDRGWQARDGSSRLRVERDVLDNLVIFPVRAGQQNIVLEYREPWIVWAGYAITFFTLLALVLYPKVIRPRLQAIAEHREEKQRELDRQHQAELHELGLDDRVGPPDRPPDQPRRKRRGKNAAV